MKKIHRVKWRRPSVTVDFMSYYRITLLGHAVAELVEELRYKPEGRGFDSQWFH